MRGRIQMKYENALQNYEKKAVILCAYIEKLPFLRAEDMKLNKKKLGSMAICCLKKLITQHFNAYTGQIPKKENRRGWKNKIESLNPWLLNIILIFPHIFSQLSPLLIKTWWLFELKLCGQKLSTLFLIQGACRLYI